MLKQRWEDDIDLELRDVEWKEIDGIDLSQGKCRLCSFMNVIMNLQIP
jgi:hypothetical protein